MPIANRNLPPDTILTARHKGIIHTVLVLADADGRLAFELDGGTIYRSLSAAGSAMLSGTACNGWKVFSVQGEEQPASPSRAPAADAPAKPASRGRSKRVARSADLTGWTDERLAALCESIEHDLPALDGEVLEQSTAMLESAKAELAKRQAAQE